MPKQYLLLSLSIIFWTSTGHAEMYSDKKPDEGKAKVDEIKIHYSHDIAQAPKYKPNTMGLQPSQEQKNERDDSSLQNKKPKLAWGGNQPETDDTQCALGRAILNGVAKHRNGAALDDYDKKTAQNDVQRYCH